MMFLNKEKYFGVDLLSVFAAKSVHSGPWRWSYVWDRDHQLQPCVDQCVIDGVRSSVPGAEDVLSSPSVIQAGQILRLL